MKSAIFASLSLLTSAAMFADESSYKTSQGNNGRYTIFINANVREDTFVLDTLTGRVWQFVKNSQGYTRIKSVPYINTWDGADALIPETSDIVDRVNERLRSMEEAVAELLLRRAEAAAMNEIKAEEDGPTQN